MGVRAAFIFILSLCLFGLYAPAHAEVSPTSLQMVEIYGTAECGPCVELYEELTKRRVFTKFYNLPENKEAEERYLSEYGRGNIPLAVVGGEVFRGYELEAVLDAYGRALDRQIADATLAQQGENGSEIEQAEAYETNEAQNTTEESSSSSSLVNTFVIVAVLAFIICLVFGLSKKVVIFSSREDLLLNFLPWLFLYGSLICFALVSEGQIMAYVGGALLIAVGGLFIRTYVTTTQANNSLVVGVVFGTFKIAICGLGCVLILGFMNPEKRDGRRKLRAFDYTTILCAFLLYMVFSGLIDDGSAWAARHREKGPGEGGSDGEHFRESGSSSQTGYQSDAEDDPWHVVLGVKQDASEEEIKHAYRALVKKFHPDNILSKDLPEEFIHFANNRFRVIQEAYEKSGASA